MCGIVGILNREGGEAHTPDRIDKMIGMVRHRGPESAGRYLDDDVALGHARLSIIDLSGGLQPLTNEDETLWLVCNGEVFNYIELRAELETRGHRFRTGSDCETILHLYEESGLDFVHVLNGQFAFALWDRRRRRLVLGRDRLGIRPVFYTLVHGQLIFGSEIKAVLSYPDVPRELDVVALGDVFRSWSPVPPRTMFKGIRSLRPGHLLIADAAGIRTEQYWQLRFPDTTEQSSMDEHTAAEKLRELLLDSTRLRLRADVPVGAYVSGGLDSSAVTALARRHTTNRLQTFAVAFTDGEYDERPHQERVAGLLGTEHHTITCRPEDIARVFPDVVWHAETPLVRSAPAPLYMLASLVRHNGFKVVLTGEGADEFLLGYDIFKEARVRAFWASRPDSRIRPLLLRRLYGHIPDMAQPSQAYLQAFFGTGLDQAQTRGFSHLIRWTNTSRLHRYFTADVLAELQAAGQPHLEQLLAAQGSRWGVMARAQYNEITTFLDPYLLSSQGDRVAMAHAVEGRFPFLDYRVVEFCNSLAPKLKMHGLTEKTLLKRAVADLLPVEILTRPKQPFRAPIRAAFAGSHAPAYVDELLGSTRISAERIFKPEAVRWLLNRARTHARLSEVENMALVGLVSFGLFQHAYFDEFSARVEQAHHNVVPVADFRAHRLEPALSAA